MSQFWLENPSILIDRDYLLEIFPSRKLNIVDKLNAIVRLSIYYTIILYFYKKDKNYLVIPLVTAGITWLIWSRRKDIHVDNIMKDSIEGKLDDLVKINDLNTECRIPTKENPFMNPTLADYGRENIKKSCPSYNNVGVQRRMNELYNEDIYRDIKDVFNKNTGDRQFYTVPGNQVPNDQGSFSQWCYGQPPGCKEGNQIACLSQLGRGGGVGQNAGGV